MRSKRTINFIILSFIIFLGACTSKRPVSVPKLEGTYIWEKGYQGNFYIAFVKEDSISFWRSNNEEYWEGEYGDTIPVLIASGTYRQNGPNSIKIKSDKNDPFKNIEYSRSPSEGDSVALILKFPNYDFSQGLYPILNIHTYYGDVTLKPDDPDYIEPGLYEIKVECRSDSVVTTLPRLMLQEDLYFYLTQSTYINKNALQPYLGQLSFQGYAMLYLDEHPNENISITFPNITNQVFDLLCLDNFIADYDDKYLVFLNWYMLKISSDIITTHKERRSLYNKLEYDAQ